MPKITYIDYTGTSRCVDAENGMSLMEIAINNNVPGIDGDCGGECACATCHVHVDADWLDKLPPSSDQEVSMLEFCDGVDHTSRLGCQIKICPTLDGIVVRTPAAQH
ncbi:MULTISPECIES: 2Fe-2S iron-sulfur cluster-binding protein [Mycobacteriaceae]|jgi:ferredoxin, 2Fe-2S|uniref:Ferredoxin n=1 Tax=Mycobacterium sp. HXN-1500 TaxID=285354 RepID=Q65A62_9MYCO|nr:MULTISPECIES: 2Fe-2S iron-sulfur cluster-binding protein [Mycobacteriaceae]UPV00787.1 ferrodoxin reductase [Vector pUC57 lymic]GAY17262.1 2Fe-2S ferredoxin [Mycobacterium sp. shizuoka-1]CAH04398.1 ferredoxin [Mycobacterium sp. HXN-1500]